ncbi:hypothetical protein FH972_024373 [Carpinus fangiana]|uniref:Uncharacterized protein n=1 Tax=Carpinus fangiana TaxID=176857 RepID=A0A5N6KXV5_9ROSI|nr:hypothetical protein FH972_024373 [Carpinus fangiana]
MSFGWSVGDILTGIELSAKIYKAFNDAHENAPTQYRVLIHEFKTFHASFINLHHLLREYDQSMYMGYPAIEETLKKCFAYLRTYDVVDIPFAHASPRQAVKRVLLQVNWAIVVQKDVDLLRKELAGHARIISICSAAATFRSILEIRAQNKELREQNQKILLSTQHIISRLDGSVPPSLPSPVLSFQDRHLTAADVPQETHAQTLHRKLEALKAADRLLLEEERKLRLIGGSQDLELDDLENVERDQLVQARRDLDFQTERLRNLETRMQGMTPHRTETFESTTSTHPPSLIHDGMETRPESSPTSLTPWRVYGLPDDLIGLPRAAIDVVSPLSVSPSNSFTAAAAHRRTDTLSSEVDIVVSQPKDNFSRYVDDAFLSPFASPDRPPLASPFIESRPHDSLSSPDTSPRQRSPSTFTPPMPTQTRRSTIMSTISIGHQWASFCKGATIVAKDVPSLTCGACARRCQVELLWTERESGGLTIKAECVTTHTCILVHTFPSDMLPIPHIEHSGAAPDSALTVAFKNNSNCGQARFPTHRSRSGPALLSYKLPSSDHRKKFQELVCSMELVASFDVTLVRTDLGDGGRTETLRLWLDDKHNPGKIILMVHGRMNPKADASYFQESKQAFVPLTKKDIKSSVTVRLTLARFSTGTNRKDSFSSFSSGESVGSSRSSAASLHRPKWIEFQFETRDDRKAFCQCWEPSLAVS